jgi:hypothetical protein
MSTRTVDVLIEPGQTRSRTLFMLESIVGVEEEAGADMAEASAESPTSTI